MQLLSEAWLCVLQGASEEEIMSYFAANKCSVCGEYDRPAVVWSNEKQERMLRRCKNCFANFDGAGIWLPLKFVPLHIQMEIPFDPCHNHSHGHAACEARDKRQMKLL